MEDDWYLLDLETGAEGAEGQLNVEDVALGSEGLQLDVLEESAPYASVAAREVLHVHAEDRTCIKRSGATKQPAERRPLCDPSAGDIARAEHEVVVLSGSEQHRQIRRVVR